MSAISGVSAPPTNAAPQPIQAPAKSSSKSSQADANTVSPVTAANAAKESSGASSHVVDIKA
jgi:hypothetical protein